MIRHFLNRVDAGDAPMSVAWALPLAAFALGIAIYWTAPTAPAHMGEVSDAEITHIITTHCVMCHAVKPKHEGFIGGEPPKGVVLDTLDGVRKNAPQIVIQAVHGRAMPLGNETGITDAERTALGAWIAQQ